MAAMAIILIDLIAAEFLQGFGLVPCAGGFTDFKMMTMPRAMKRPE